MRQEVRAKRIPKVPSEAASYSKEKSVGSVTTVITTMEISINPADPAAQLAKSLSPSKISDELEVSVRSIDELPDEARDELLGINPPQPPGPNRVPTPRRIPATGWFKQF